MVPVWGRCGSAVGVGSCASAGLNGRAFWPDAPGLGKAPNAQKASLLCKCLSRSGLRLIRVPFSLEAAGVEHRPGQGHVSPTSPATCSTDAASSVRSALFVATRADGSAKLRRSGMWGRTLFMPLLRSLARRVGAVPATDMALLTELGQSNAGNQADKVQQPAAAVARLGWRQGRRGESIRVECQ